MSDLNATYAQDLSPGCQICRQGKWSCLFINDVCTADCYFCPKLTNQRTLPRANRIPFPDIEAYLAFISTQNITGISFSGGEPLLSLDQILKWTFRIRERFGSSVYLWLYTNGDLINNSILSDLAKVGIDEIRFNICARDYDLSRVALACESMPIVTVEIPAIPNDENILWDAIKKMSKIGVSYLNLHELYVTSTNHEAMKRQGYHFDFHGFSTPIQGSKDLALRMIQKGTAQGSKIFIHYCSLSYKQTTQNTVSRHQASKMLKKPFQTITASGFIRCVFIQLETQEVFQEINLLKEKKGLWDFDLASQRLFIHPSLLIQPELQAYKGGIQYFDAEFSTVDKELMEIYQVFKEKMISPGFRLRVGGWETGTLRDISVSDLKAILIDNKLWLEKMRRYEEG